MFETRVNLKHLLEDIRDSYGIPLEEIIIVELIANALDSRASSISFFIDQEKNALTVVDNGQGMKRKEIKNYHDIATTTKVRGKGIGFAGIGAKLSLLISSSVITETKGGYGSRCATTWHLTSENHAPWKFIPYSQKVSSPRGTAITINFFNPNFLLLNRDFIFKTIYRHFYPLLHPQFFQTIYRYIYKKEVEFFVNGEKVFLSDLDISRVFKTFRVSIDKRTRKIMGFGYLTKDVEIKNNDENLGLAISTYGKIIKSGWEWIGIMPKEPYLIQGVVEIPCLAEILTTNKMDFLRDASSLKKYYRYRKAIQEAIFPILEELGEELGKEQKIKKLRPLTREIETAISYILDDFPELIPLLGIRRIKKGKGLSLKERPLVKIIEEKPISEIEEQKKEKIEKQEEDSESKNKKQGKKGPALSIGFEEREEDFLGRMIENTIWINKIHPAYLKAKKENFEEYHILFCVALILSKFLEEEKSPQEFINNFLSSWGRDEKKQTLF